MSDIQEEQKRLYKRAEDNDLLRKYNNLKTALDESQEVVISYKEENARLNNIINRTIKYVESLSSSGRGCDIYEDIKKEILNILKGDNK